MFYPYTHRTLRRRGRSATIFFALLAMIVVGVSLMSRSAFAAHRGVDVHLDELAIYKEHGRVVVDYEVDRRDWRRLQRLGIDARLNLYLPRHPHDRALTFQHSLPLSARRGRLVFPRRVKLRHARHAEIRLVGRHHGHHIDRVTFGERCGPQIRVAVERHRHGHGHGHARRDRHHREHRAEARAMRAARIVDACAEATPFHRQREACMSVASGYAHDPVPTIEACAAATSFSSDFDRCLRSGRELGPRGDVVIAACDRASTWSSELHACLDHAMPRR